MNDTCGTQCLRKFQEWKLKQQISDESVEMAKTERAALVESMSLDDLKFRAGGSKICKGNISPGCETCVNGLISFLYINGLCTCDCFFCPQNRAMEHERLPSSAEMTFHDPDRYVDYLETFGFKGVGFSGGEPLLVMERLLLFLARIKKRFAGNIYTWVYTNGDLVDEQKLKSLRDTGMDEIRINLSARDYDLEPVRQARRYFNTVTVEIPAIPEDVERVKRILPAMADIGVMNFNVHQLSLSKYNFNKISVRDYSMFHTRDSGLVIYDSEVTALRLLKHASDQQFDFSLNYCSTIYKERYQSSGMRKQLAKTVIADYEKISSSGYIIRVSARDSKENLEKVILTFQSRGSREGLWELLKTDSGDFCLLFHPDLIDSLPQKKNNLSFHCFEAIVIPQDQHDEIFFQSFEERRCTSNGVWTIGLKRVANKNDVDVCFIKTLMSDQIEANGHLPGEEHRTLNNLKSFVRLEYGFSDLISTKTYWTERKRAAERKRAVAG